MDEVELGDDVGRELWEGRGDGDGHCEEDGGVGAGEESLDVVTATRRIFLRIICTNRSVLGRGVMGTTSGRTHIPPTGHRALP